MSAVAKFVEHLHGVKTLGDGYMCRCPAHEDSVQSLKVDHGEDGRVLLHCLSGDTRILTANGTKPIVQLAGRRVPILTTSGIWKRALISEFGSQRLIEIAVTRSGVRKVIRATGGHRWILEKRSDSPNRIVVTDKLKPGDRLMSTFTRQSCRTVSGVGVAHGFTYGDGSLLPGRSGSVAQFCGPKDDALLPYFPEQRVYFVSPEVKRVGGLPKFFKRLPSLTESVPYLIGWMAGYFSADGSVAETGNAEMYSADYDSLQWFRDVGNVVGIGTYGIRTHVRSGFGKEPTNLYALTIRSEDLFGEFFILPEHRKRFSRTERESRRRPSRHAWIVESVSLTDKVEPVFCATVPETHAFVLEDNILTGNCHAGCRPSEILAALNLPMAALFAPKPDGGGSKAPSAIYDYRDEDGELRYQVLRFPPKDFRQRQPDGQGGWIWRMKGVRYLPYRLNELKNQPVVVVVEGEKDANRLWSLNIPATTNAGGAKKWRASITKKLKDVGVQRIVVLPDNDGPGISHAEEIAVTAKTHDVACSVIMLPGLPPKGDVSDWLDAGHDGHDLMALVSGTPYIVPPAGGLPVPALTATAPPTAQAPAGASILEPGGFAASDYHLTDMGAAEAFRDRVQNEVRFDHAKGEWVVWDGHYWRPDSNERVYRLAHDHVRQWQTDAMTIADYATRKSTADFAMKLEKRAAIDNFLAVARRLLPIASVGDEWNTDGWLLGCPNGVVDLRTGILRDGERGDWITQQIGTAYDPTATCPRWETFVSEVLDDNAEVIEFVKRALGYSLTGDMREQCFFMAIGGGSNGKSLFLETLEQVWGTYAHRAKMRLFIGGGDVDKYHLADLKDARLILASETKPELRMNEDVIKNFTGGEPQRAEHKYGHPFTFQPTGKIWLGVNHEPRVSDDSMGFWRRVRLIPFPRTFSGSANNLGLRDMLRAEAPGILRWAVDGCADWLAKGLETPLTVLSAVESYQQHEDPLAEFFEARCEFGADEVASFAAISASYNEWAEQAKIPTKERLPRRALGNQLKRRFTAKDAGGVKRYAGLSVKVHAKDLLNS